MAESIFRRLKSKFAGVIVQRKPGIQLEVLQYTGDANDCLDGTGAFSPKAGGGSGITQLTGDVAAGPGSGSQVATLSTTGVTAGTYGDATNVGQFTVDVKGRVTAASNVAITAGTVTVTGSPSSGNLTKFSGSTSITNGDLSGDVTTSGTLATTINPTLLAGRLLGIQIFSTAGSGTYTPTSGTASIVLEMVGGGGGGGGVASAAVNQVILAAGGGGGAFLRKRLTANFSGASYVVGAKGTGGSAGANNGTDGTASTFTDTAGSPTTYTAGGGAKGVTQASFAPPICSNAGAGGTATNGDLNVSGYGGGIGVAPNQFVGYSGSGGNSFYAPYTGGAPVVNATSSAGGAASGYGGGGAGASSSNAGGSKAGGDGTDGIIIIYEYS